MGFWNWLSGESQLRKTCASMLLLGYRAGVARQTREEILNVIQGDGLSSEEAIKLFDEIVGDCYY